MLWASNPQRRDSARREACSAAFVPFGEMVTDEVNQTTAGDLVATWEIEPIPFETAQPYVIGGHHATKCNWAATLDERFMSYETCIQRFDTERLDPVLGASFEARFDADWAEQLARKPFLTNRRYLTLVYRPPRGERLAESLAVMAERAETLERMLHALSPRRLGTRVRGSVEFSEFAEFAGVLVNGSWAPVRAGRGSLHRRLPRVRASFRSGQVELRGIDDVRYATMLDILDYGEGFVEPGTLGPKLYESAEYIETISFAPMNRHAAVTSIDRQGKQLRASEDPVRSQIEALEDAKDAVGGSAMKWGRMYYGLCVFGATPHDSKRNAARLASAIGEHSGIQLVRVDLLGDDAWWSQCPGNAHLHPRHAEVSSRAYAALADAHGFFRGKRDGNPWGQALLVAKTRSGQPIYVNPHASPLHEASEGKKYSGAMIITGISGSGKTVFEAACLLQSRRWNPAPFVIVLDKDRSLELVVRAMRGKYKQLAVGEPSGINPFQWPMTRGRPTFLRDLVLAMARDAVWRPTTWEIADLENAIQTLAGFEDPRDRSVSTLAQNLQKSNGLRERIHRWTRGQPLGWVFDELDDDLPHDTRMAGFDYTEFLPVDEIRTPMLMALLQYAEDKIDGQRVMLVMEEAWRPLRDPALAAFAHDKSKTIRKKNGLPIFTTQEPVDLRNDLVGETLVSQGATFVCFADGKSPVGAYVEGLRLTEAEEHVVRTLGQSGGHHFFYKQGEHSCVVEFDLSGLEEHLWILSGSEDNVRLLDQVREDVGDDPGDWMPALFQAIRDREAGHHLRRAA